MSDRDVTCHCGKCGKKRGKLLPVHYECPYEGWKLSEIQGANFTSCGWSWEGYLTHGGDFRQSGFSIEDIVQSPAELAWWNSLDAFWQSLILPQVLIGNTDEKFFILDFYIPSLRFCIEIDGRYHDGDEQRIRDSKRDDWLGNRGIRVNRVPASIVFAREKSDDVFYMDELSLPAQILGEAVRGYPLRYQT